MNFVTMVYWSTNIRSLASSYTALSVSSRIFSTYTLLSQICGKGKHIAHSTWHTAYSTQHITQTAHRVLLQSTDCLVVVWASLLIISSSRRDRCFSKTTRQARMIEDLEKGCEDSHEGSLTSEECSTI